MTFTADTTNTSAVLAVADTNGIRVGMLVSGTGITSGALVVSVVTNVSVTISIAATATGTGVSLKAQNITEAQSGLVNEPTATSFSVSIMETKRALAGMLNSGTTVKPDAVTVQVKRSGAELKGKASAIIDIKLVHIANSGAKLVTVPTAKPIEALQISTGYGEAFFEASANAVCNLVGASDTDGLSFSDLIDEVLHLWGISRRCSAPESAISRAINDINGALQMVWNNAEGRNYWTNDTLEITLADGESSQDLPDYIQNVSGPCRRADNRRPLSPIGTLGELETFFDLYGDESATTEPLAYHVERIAQSDTLADAARCIFHVTPPVSGDPITFLLEIVKEAPRYSKYDIENSPVVPLPHAYGESLLLPVIRYKASCYHLFRSQEQKETIDREYQQAALSLGLADPLPGKSGDNMERRSA